MATTKLDQESLTKVVTRSQLPEKSSRNSVETIKNLETLIQELQGYQIELQSQNEELRRSTLETEEARRRYSDLYDFAPVAYVSLDSKGIVTQVNLTCAALLKLSRRAILRRGFRRFVKGSDQEKFLGFCRQILEDVQLQNCEVQLFCSDGSTFDARLTGICSENNGSAGICQIAIFDISDWKRAQQAVEEANRQLEMRMRERTSVLQELEVRSTALKEANDMLEVQYQERKRAGEQASRQSKQMEGLSRRLLMIQEVERRQLALDLHDQLGQVLTGVRLNLQRVQRDGVGKSGQRLADAISMLDSALSQVRQWSFDLRPPLLDDLGLVAALRWYVDKQVRRFVTPYFKMPRREKRFRAEVEIACFRLAQEALTNVVRHSKAKRVWIELHENGKRLQLRIVDDGVGFDVAAAQDRAAGGGSLGLLGMQERLRLCGGSTEITSTPGSGTTVLATLSLNHRETGQRNNAQVKRRKKARQKTVNATPFSPLRSV